MTFAALLLTGGESRRMGRDKATLVVDGEPLWERQIKLLRALGLAEIFVSARTPPAWLPVGVELLLDDRPSRGPLSGVAKALATVRTTHLVVLAVDMPFMTAGELGALLALATKGCGVIPMIGDRADPLAAIYPVEASEDFRTALTGSNFSLQPLVNALADAGKVKLCFVPKERAHFYQNLNTPGDFKCSDATLSV